MYSKNSVLISIIIPFYNVNLKYFNRCVDSIRLQTFTCFEVIVIDDGSDKKYYRYLDNLTSIDDRFRVFHQKNSGVSDARNNGISYANGRTICFVDADDYMAPWALEVMWKAFNNVDAVAAYYDLTSNSRFQFKKTNMSCTVVKNKELKRTTLVGMICKPDDCGYLSAGPYAVLFDAKIAKTIKFPKGIKYMEDVIWNYKFYDKCKTVAIVKECIYAYRQHDGSATHSYSVQMIRERVKSLKLLNKTVKDNYEWLALRALSSYATCCKCCALDTSVDFKYKKHLISILNNDPVWNSFKIKGVAKKWELKYKIKRIAALSGLMPQLYYIKERRNIK